MPVNIKSVAPNSPASKAKIVAGDTLISINGKEINDVLDYQFYATDNKLKLEFSDKKIKIKKQEYEDLGLEFETYLMDEKRHCKNNCIFCFINQLPKGMRETLYFKDDDARLSFLQGNYITMTNLTDHEVDRIIEMKLNVNVSVHTTNPELRVMMTKNPNAGNALRHLYKMAAAGLSINTQLVMVPGVNDGKELEKSLIDLCMLYPAVKSIACVPIGITKFREGLFEVTPYNKESAAKTLDTIEEFGDMMFEKYHDRVVYPADEFFLLAEREMPDYEYYGEFDQYENGIGMCVSLQKEFSDAIADKIEFKETDKVVRHKTIATGTLAFPLISSLAKQCKSVFENTQIDVYEIKNNFFGETITVAGLITAQDLIAQLTPYKDKLGDCLLLTNTMLRTDTNIFLDDLTTDDVEKALGIPVKAIAVDGFVLLDSMLE